jgi:hypothetical protein
VGDQKKCIVHLHRKALHKIESLITESFLVREFDELPGYHHGTGRYNYIYIYIYSRHTEKTGIIRKEHALGTSERADIPTCPNSRILVELARRRISTQVMLMGRGSIKVKF